MKQIKASEIKPSMFIIDQLDEKIVVDEVWPSQGTGLGIVVKGKRILDFKPSYNRYLDEDTLVQEIVREEKSG